MCPFSTWSIDSASNLTIFIGTQKVRINTTPHLLGVILDRSLTFYAHLKKLNVSLSFSICIIRATAHTSWRWHCSTLKMVFNVLIRSKPNYATPAWQSWLYVTNLSCLDCLQNHSLRFITGQLVSTSLKTLWLEDNFQSYNICSNRLILKAREKALRSTDDHPRCVALAADTPQFLQNHSSFRWKAEELSTPLPPKLQQTKHHPFSISTIAT